MQSVRQINAAEPAAENGNDSYSGVNVATIVFGGLILALAVVGTFLPKEKGEVPPDSTGWSSMSENPASRYPDHLPSDMFLDA